MDPCALARPLGFLDGFIASAREAPIAILMPITFSMTAEAGLIMMGALFAGAMWGGSVSAILINTPGTPGAAATVRVPGHEQPAVQTIAMSKHIRKIILLFNETTSVI